MSVSYPYFTVAKQHNVPYESVLALVEDYNKNGCETTPLTDWRFDAYVAWKKEQNRRKER